jgi:hypothetical protein
MNVELDLLTIGYLSFRIAPFILMSYLCLFSLFNREIKGLVLLSGLLLSSFLTVLVSKTQIFNFNVNKENQENTQNTPLQTCNILTMGKSGPVSQIPLSLHTYSFLCSYFIMCIIYNFVINENLLTIFVFVVLILADSVFLSRNGCSTSFSLIMSFLLGSIFGITWFYLIGSTRNPELQFFNGKTSQETCNKTDREFSCEVEQT